MKHRILSAVLVLCLVLTALQPVGVLAAQGDLPKTLTLEPSAENKLPAAISLVRSGSAYTLYLPGNVDPAACFFSWSDGLSASDGDVQYESGALPVPAPGQAKTFTFRKGTQTASFTVTTWQGSAQLKPIFIEIDESQGTIAAMNNDPNHNTECTGVIYIDGVLHGLPKMKGRGNYAWSQSKDKRAYNVTLGKKVNLLGIASEKTKKWSFLANVCDHSLLRDKVGYDIGYQLGIAYDSASADVWMNGEYQGVYLITPKTDSYVSDDGYLIENDNNTEPAVADGGDPSFTLRGLYGSGGTDVNNNWDNRITVKKIGDNLLLNSQGILDESPANLTAVAGTIQTWTQDVWDAIRSADGYNAKGVYYADYIDLETFAKMYLVLEYTKDYDVCSGSNFMYRNGTTDQDKLYAGPVWDLDSSLGCTQENGSLRLGPDISMTTGYGWFIRNIHEYKTSIYKALGRHPDFMDEVYRVYEEYHEVFDHVPENVTAFADEIADSAMMNFNKVDPVDNYNVARYYSDTVKNAGTQYEQHYKATTNSKTDWPIYIENLKTFTVARSLFFRNNLVPTETPGETGADLAPRASVYSDYTASWENLNGINDPSFEPEASSMGIGLGWGNWSQTTGSEHYVGYTWTEPVSIGALDLYWYDDGGGTRVPSAYRLQYKDTDGVWQTANIRTDYSETTALNQYNRILLDPVTTTDLRLIMTTASNASGIYRFKVYGQTQQSESLDLAALEAAVAVADALEPNDYTEESAAALQNALQAAKTILADENAAQADVDAAAQALEAAIKALVDKVQAVIELINALEEPVTLESEEALEAARAAYDALSDEEKERVANYVDLLLAEIEYYKLQAEEAAREAEDAHKEEDKAIREARDAASQALQEYEAHAAVGHDDAHITAAEAALAEAVEAIASAHTAQELQQCVDEGIEAIDEALRGGLIPIGKTALEKAIEEAEAVKTDEYTDESVAAMQEALKAAKAVAADPEATQEEIDAATEALREALAALEEKDIHAELEKLAREAKALAEEALAAAEAARQAADEAAASASADKEAAEAAQKAAEAAQQKAEAARKAAEDAQAAADAADADAAKQASEAARQAAEAAERAAETAKAQAAAQAAQEKAEAAQKAAEAAQKAAEEAEQAAGADKEAAEAARKAAEDAQKQAEAAKQAAESARQAADEANAAAAEAARKAADEAAKAAETLAQAAERIAKSVDDADAARKAAEEAKAQAEEAQAAAEAAKQAAAEAAASAADDKEAAEAARKAAEEAQKKAEAAQKAAQDAQAAADAADADAAKQASEAARQAAEAAEKAAETAKAQAAAQAAQEKAEAAQKAAEAAQKAAEEAEQAAGQDKAAADAAREAAEDARKLAEAAQKAAEAAKQAADAANAAAAEAAKQAAADAAKVAEALARTAELVAQTAEDKATAEKAAKEAKDAALTAEKTNAKVQASIAALGVDPDTLSPENQKKLDQIMEDAISAIDDAEDAEAVQKALDEAVKAIEGLEELFRFDDVKDASAYYFDPVYWAYFHDPQITTGTSANLFSPGMGCTRAQVVTFLWRAAGEPAPKNADTGFSDVPAGQWYSKAVAWAVENEITKGTGEGKFSPDRTCTRREIVTFLWRANGEPKAKSGKNPFTDVPEGQFYTDAVLWAVEKGVTKGTSDTGFSPAKVCSRAEIVTFLYRDKAE